MRMKQHDPQEHVPEETMLVFRTGSAGAWGQCNSASVDYMQIKKSHSYQLNAAARAALRHRPRWQLLDVEQMLEQFECPHAYLRDIIHLNPRVTWTILNQYMNMLHVFWGENGYPYWRKTGAASRLSI